MSYLVDTNGWIAFFQDSRDLSEKAAKIMESGEPCYISLASVWEASIKIGLKKLILPYDVRSELQALIEENGFSLLPVEMDDATAVVDLPPHHGDPFDRIMAVQAARRSMRVISRDPIFEKYGLRRIW